ncbi:hypothetical protein EAE99_003769 [Botrytis elliptica]|nr:hypothetical protein EAE99_003769 [Botrytis elliptica]
MQVDPGCYGDRKSFCNLVSQHANLHPDSIALSYNGDTLSYDELETQSTQIATLLYDRGVRPRDKVPILTSRCSLMVVCLLAISKIGACYIPMDITWSSERIRIVLSTINADIMISTESETGPILNDNMVLKSEIEAVLGQRNGESQLFHHVGYENLEDPAYIIFTSGTTGAPKGVVISNASLLNYVQQGGVSKPFNMNVKSGDKVVLLFSIGFDACTGVLFSTLCNGGQLVLSSQTRFIDDLKTCDILPITPSVLATIQYPENFTNIKSIFLGGESPNHTLIKKWWRPDRKIFNAYGPTETTISSSIFEVLQDQPILLGSPMEESMILLLDKNLDESAEGEICISGPGLAIGYFKDEDMTEQKFINWKGTRIYRTGDFGRRNAGDGIVFLGRQDSLVKNRGFLINLETEVVPALRAFEGVTAAIALLHEGRLVAFIAPKIEPLLVRNWLARHYDAFLVPDIIHSLYSLPLSHNGKVDIPYLRSQLQHVPEPQKIDNKRGTTTQILISGVALALGIPESKICPKSSFWDLGGNSLSAMKLLSYLHKHNLTLSVVDLFSSQSLRLTASLAQAIDTDTSQFITRQDESKIGSSSHQLVEFPMTVVQSSMIKACLREPLANYLLISISCDDCEILEAGRLKRAWDIIMKRHLIFSATFNLLKGTQATSEVSEIDWSEISSHSKDIESTVRNVLDELLSLPKTPCTGQTFRPVNAFRVIRDHKQSFNLLWLVHHGQIDGWSMSILMEDLKAVLDGKALSCPGKFSEFVHERSQYVEKTRQGSADFWKTIFHGHSPSCRLKRPTSDMTRPEDKMISFPDKVLKLRLSSVNLEASSRRLKVSVPVIIYACLSLLLRNYLADDKVNFGVVISGRSLAVPLIHKTVGPLINTCPFPVDLRGSMNKMDLLNHVQARLLKIIDQQWSAADYLESIPGDNSWLLNPIVAIEYDLPEIPCPMNSGTWKFQYKSFMESGLTISIGKDQGEMFTRFQYSTKEYEPAMIERLQRHFHNIIHGIIDQSTDTLLQVRDKMMNQAEVDSLVYPPQIGPHLDDTKTLKDSFEQAVDQWPEFSALESHDGSLTYLELENRANHVATYLAKFVRPNDVVATLSDGSLSWIVTVLSIMKAGGIYAPVDSKLPAKRREKIIRQAKAMIYIIPYEDYGESLRIAGTRTLFLRSVIKEPLLNTTRLKTKNKPSDAAYLIFTSGSTGHPKGIKASHGPILSYLASPESRLHSKPGRRNAQMLSVGFDVSIAEIFGTLCYGATLVLKNPAHPFSHLTTVDAAMATPSLLSSLVSEELNNLDTIFLAGEVVTQGLVDRWAVNGRKLYNGYGPCECTIVVLIATLRRHQEPTVGKPVPGTACYILDAQRRPVPIGLPGEICISGLSVSQGYLDNEEETRLRFVRDPFCPGQMMYCTGDIGVWTESKEVRYLGREDNQVKVRGFRIELEEVEQAIMSVSGLVTNAAAVVQNDSIYAFATPATVDVGSIQRELQNILPYYSLPTRIFAMDRLPLSPNLKINRKILRDLIVSNGHQFSGERASTIMEKLIERIWKEILNLSDFVEIGTDDDFSMLGGNSLMQIKALQKLSDILACNIPLQLLICNTTLSSLAATLEQYCTHDRRRAFRAFNGKLLAPHRAVSYLEQEIHSLQANSPSSSSFNIVCKLALRGNLDLTLLAEAVNTLISTNYMLRTRYQTINGNLQRFVSEDILPTKILKSANELSIENLINAPFDLSNDQLIRSVVAEECDQTILIIVSHHIIADKRSINIMLTQISRNYIDMKYRQPRSDLGKSDPSYNSWISWFSQSPPMLSNSQTKQFWEEFLQPLPQLFPRWQFSSGIATGASRYLDISERHSPHNVSGNYLAACAVAISKLFCVDNVVLGIPYSNRMEAETHNILGTFLDRVPIKIDCSSTNIHNIRSFADSVHTSYKSALAHVVPYCELASLMDAENLFDVMVIFHKKEDSHESNLVIPEIEASNVIKKSDGVQFPLMIEFFEESMGMVCLISYAIDMVTSAEITALSGILLETLESLVGREIS